MATQNCPKCNSSRIRQGYRPTSVLMKLVFRYNLLCDECNWEFSGFAVPGTVRAKSKKKKGPKSSGSLQNLDGQNENLTDLEDEFSGISDAEVLSATKLIEEMNIEEIPQTKKVKVKRKIRVKLH